MGLLFLWNFMDAACPQPLRNSTLISATRMALLARATLKFLMDMVQRVQELRSLGATPYPWTSLKPGFKR